MLIVLLVILAAGLLIGQKGFVHRNYLMNKKAAIERENILLAKEIEALGRKVTLLRTDSAIVEKTAKSMLGMARRDEMVYIFAEKQRKVGCAPTEDGSAQGEAAAE
jgi:cell division protein FtsB